ncbi:MAG: hypothetical protein PHV85_00115 [Desulfovibrionaceae bacterium]|nr:hypothetical protein [Desulfovibrionaceae bacterium]
MSKFVMRDLPLAEKQARDEALYDMEHGARPKKEENAVIIEGLRIPFWDLVTFLVKLSVAAIPAAFILGFVFMVLKLF